MHFGSIQEVYWAKLHCVILAYDYLSPTSKSASESTLAVVKKKKNTYFVFCSYIIYSTQR